MSKNTYVAERKDWWKSKTLWVNTLAILAGIFSGLATELSANNAVTVVAVANIILRVITKDGIKFKN